MWKWSVAPQCISGHIQPPDRGTQGPLHSDLKFRKQHLMLLYFPLSTLHFRSYLPLLEAAEYFPLLVSLPWTVSPLEILSFLLRLSVKILPVVQGPHSPWNIPNLRYSLLTLNSESTFFCASSHDLYLILLCVVVCGYVLFPLLAIPFLSRTRVELT